MTPLSILSSGLQAGISGLNTAFGALRTIFGALSTAFRFVFSHMLGFAGLLVRTGALLAGVVIGGLVSFVAAIGAATKSAMEYSRAVIDLRNSTGMSTSMAQGAAGRFGAFGIGADALSNGGQYHGITSMTGRVFGVNAYDPQSINARAQSYGNGFMGFQMKQSMLSGIGQNNPQGQWLANLPQAKVQAQAAFQQNAASSMGVSPEIIARLAEDLPLLIGRFTILKDLLFNKIAGAALPYLEAALTRGADLLAENGDAIAEGIGKAIEWLGDTSINVGSFLMQYWPLISQSIMTAVTWLWDNVPAMTLNAVRFILKAFQWLSDGFFGVARTVIGFLRTLGEADSGFSTFVVGFLGGIDTVINTLQFLGDLWHNFIATLANVLIFGIKALAGGVYTALRAVGLGGTSAGQSAQKLHDMEYEKWQFHGEGEKSNLAERFGKYQTMGDIQDKADRVQKWFDGHQEGTNDRLGALNDFVNKAATALSIKTDPQLEMLGRIEKHTGATAMNTQDTARSIGGFAGNTVNRVLSYIAEDAYLGVAGG